MYIVSGGKTIHNFRLIHILKRRAGVRDYPYCGALVFATDPGAELYLTFDEALEHPSHLPIRECGKCAKSATLDGSCSFPGCTRPREETPPHRGGITVYCDLKKHNRNNAYYWRKRYGT